MWLTRVAKYNDIRLCQSYGVYASLVGRMSIFKLYLKAVSTIRNAIVGITYKDIH